MVSYRTTLIVATDSQQEKGMKRKKFIQPEVIMSPPELTSSDVTHKDVRLTTACNRHQVAVVCIVIIHNAKGLGLMIMLMFLAPSAGILGMVNQMIGCRLELIQQEL